MKKAAIKLAETDPTPAFPKTSQRLSQNDKAATSPKGHKRDNIFSKSRDTREDRGTRQMKTTHNSQTFTRGR